MIGRLYVWRWLKVRRAAGPRRDVEAPVWRLACAVGALVVLLAALISPLDSLAEQLFFMHMVQHMLLLGHRPDPRDRGAHEGHPAAPDARRWRRSSGAPARSPTRCSR